jgi:biopolymer transport protein ExbB
LAGCVVDKLESAGFQSLAEARVLAILEAAGWPIWPLFLASILALGIIIERFWALRRARIVPRGLLAQVATQVRQGTVDDRMIGELSAHSPLGRVLSAGLRNMNASREVIKEAIEETGRLVVHDLERYLTTLGTIASISPLMGLFGTVVGMIEMFGAQAPGSADPLQLAHGISIALYNTGFGILIAVPSMIFWRHFRALIDSFVIDMEQQAVRLVEIIHGERQEQREEEQEAS